MAKPPAFQFYATDWLTGTLELSLAARGAYITLLAYQWDKGGVPVDNKPIMKRILSCSTHDLNSALETIRIHFKKGTDGLWRNQRLERVRSDLNSYRDERSRAGRAGAERRWKVGDPVAQPMAEPIAEPLANSQQKYSTPSPTPTPTLKPSLTEGVSNPQNMPTRMLPPLIAPRICPPNMKHAWCDGRIHVPLSLHHEFQRLAPDGFNLQDWYGETELLYIDTPIGDDAFQFWRARWREHFGTTKQTDAQIKRAAQRKRDRESEQPK